MDLSKIKACNAVVEIRNKINGELVGLSITLRPDSHPEVKAVMNRVTNDYINQQRTRIKVTAEKIEANNMDKLVAATEAFTWGEGADGKPATWGGEQIQATPANIRRLYREAPWIKEQVDEFLGDVSRFLEGAD